MKKVLKLMFVFSVILFTKAMAQDTSTLFPKGNIGTNTDNYTGTIWLSELNQPDSNFTFSLAQAVYAPGSKLNWHIHPGGQYLLITEGTGYYQEKGKVGQVVHKGEIIKCLPGVEHWHGAAPNSSFAYIGVTPTANGGIWYKKAEVYSVIVNMFGNTAILLNDIDLEAVVGGNTVTNPFMVTEVYIKENGKWKMGSLTFSHLMRPVKMNTNKQQ